MGKPMAKNLLKAGYDLTVNDRNQASIDEVVDAGDLALEFCRELAPVAPEAFEARYGISPVPEDPLALIEEIALARGCRARGGEPDYDRASRLLIDDFRKGRLGKIMLEKPESGLLRLKTRT